jgi:hypothetical protein
MHRSVVCILGAMALVACGGRASESGRGAGDGPAIEMPTDAGAKPPAAVADPASTLPDAASALDPGVPSDEYPAPHPPMPRMVSLGGPILATPRVVAVTFDDDPYREGIEDFISKVGATPYWAANTAEYGIAALVADPPVHLAEKAPTKIDDFAIQSWLRKKLDGTHPEWGSPNPSTVYTIYYPAGTTVTLEGYLSCQIFGGYHSEVSINGKVYAYAVVPRCAHFIDLSGFDVITVASSHELIEAVTDPRPYTEPGIAQPDDAHLIWALLTGAETGDMCSFYDDSFYTPQDFGFAVQRSWSNAQAAAGHSPCAPGLPDTVYFNSAAVLPDDVELFGVKTKGVYIPVGQSRTIELDLYSDGPTEPWSVSATDFSALAGGDSVLDFTFNRKAGVNGEKLYMTIRVRDVDFQLGGEAFAVISKLKGRRSYWYGFVGN